MAKILLAEDEEAVRAFVRRALEGHGHEVIEVVDGGQALEKLADGDFDLLLSDIVMPVMDGIALALKVTAERPGLPILLMTGFAAEKQRAHNLDALTTEVLSKPFTMEQLVRAVDKALAKTPPPS